MSLLRALTSVTPLWPLNIKQLKETDFRDFQAEARKKQFSNMPYTKVKHIIYNQNSLNTVRFRKSFIEELTEVCVSDLNKSVSNVSFTRTKKQLPPTLLISEAWPSPKIIYSRPSLSAEKAADIRSMIPFMP